MNCSPLQWILLASYEGLSGMGDGYRCAPSILRCPVVVDNHSSLNNVDNKWEPADKPGSVEDNHSSRRRITPPLKRPTRIQRGPRQRIPIWSCSGWGLPCHELLPVARCALTAPFHPYLIHF